MPVAIDITNKTFGRLLAVRKHPERNKHGKTLWECVCSCGKTVLAQTSHLSSGETRSCGCLAIEVTKATNTKHGFTQYPEYKVWTEIKRRCYGPQTHNYADYGGRGIQMSDEWKDSFMAFFNDMGPRPTPYHTVERENNDKGYSKENCKWATRTEQANNRRTSLYFTFDGERKTLAEWCREMEVDYYSTWWLIRGGMKFEDAIDTMIAKRQT